jgi:hypothetical protein
MYKTFIFSVVFLFLGLIVYVVDRHVLYLLPFYNIKINITKSINHFVVFNWLPTFFHTLTFICFTSIAIPYSYKNTKLICLLWLFIESILEFGQMEFKHIEIDQYRFLIQNLLKYFKYGTFDWLDILSIIMASFFGYILIIKFRHNEKK